MQHQGETHSLHEEYVLRPRQLDQSPRLSSIADERLLEEDVPARRKRGMGVRVVKRGRGTDEDHVNFLRKRL